MGIVDLILNLAGLLLWLNWRSLRFDPLVKRLPATLMGTLRPAAPKKLRRWHLLVFLAALLFVRAVVYRWLVPFWTGKLDFGVVVPHFGSQSFAAMLMFSFYSFGLVLGIFYVGLLFLSLFAGPEPVHALVKVPLGRVDGWPRWAKLLLPFIGAAVCWWLASWTFDGSAAGSRHVSMAERFEQSLVVGLGSYLIWKFPAGALLALHLLASYIYFGRHPFWKYVDATALKLLQPLRKFPLQAGRVDFAPVAGMALLFLVAEVLERALTWLNARLPF